MTKWSPLKNSFSSQRYTHCSGLRNGLNNSPAAFISARLFDAVIFEFNPQPQRRS
jgi:hypothetical protein